MITNSKNKPSARASGKCSSSACCLQSNNGMTITEKLFGHDRKICIVGLGAYLLLNLLATSAIAQDISKTIKGKVLNEQGQAMQGLEIKLANANGTIDYTDALGEYEIEANSYPNGINNMIVRN